MSAGLEGRDTSGGAGPPPAPAPEPGGSETSAGEVTAMRRLAGELARLLESAYREPGRAPRAPAGERGNVTVSRSISRKLVESIEGYASGKLVAGLLLRYLVWTLGAPLALLLLLYLLVRLFPPTG